MKSNKIIMYDPITRNMFFTTEVMLRAHQASLQKLAVLKAAYDANEERLSKYKAKLLIKELNKPFFTKLYEMFGRGY